MTTSTSAKRTQADVGDHVAVDGEDADVGVDLDCPFGGDLGLGSAAVSRAEEH